MGFLTSAPIGAHVNLIIQIALLILLLFGANLARMKKFRAHQRVMVIAFLIQAGALIFWMAPSLVLNIGAFGTFGPGQLITILHMIIGYVTFFLAISSALHKTVVSKGLKWTMRVAFLTWTLAVTFGIGFYVYYYF